MSVFFKPNQRNQRPSKMLRAFLLVSFCLCIGYSCLAKNSFAAERNPFSSEQQKYIFKLIENFIKDNPEVILKAFETIQAREKNDHLQEQKRQISLNKKRLIAALDDPILGNPAGKIIIIEFFDYQCGYCKNMLRVLLEIIKENKDVKVVLKEYPILGPVSELSAQVSLAAMQQGKYELFHTSLMLLRGRLSQPAIFQVAKEVGLDIKKLKVDMKRPEILKKLKNTRELGQQLLIRGTPALVINDTVFPGALSLKKLGKIISDLENER